MTQAITDFYNALQATQQYEQQIKEAEEQLEDWYEILVSVCPHSEAVDVKSNLRGMGTRRRCKICGITDYANYGSTPGDEYDYGYAGYPHPDFWKGANVETVKEKEWNSYGRSHDYVVSLEGTVRKRW